MRHLTILTLLLAVGLPTAGADAEPTVRVVFRYDDFPHKSPLDFDRELIEAFSSRDMSCTFAVIPFERIKLEDEPYHAFPKKVAPMPAEKAELLAAAVEQGTVEAALHGYVHIETSPEPPWTEFVGLPYELQQRKIREGKQALADVLPAAPVSFVPPFNTFDDTTLRVLEEEGFAIVSAGGVSAPGGESALSFLPSTCELRLRETRKAIAQARQSGEPSPIVVVMCHPHDFLEISAERGVIDLAGFGELLDCVKEQEDVEVCTLAEAVAQSGREFSAAHYRDYCELRPDKPYHPLPTRLRPGCANVCFYPAPATLAGIRTTRMLRMGGLYGGIGLMGLVLTLLTLRWLPKLRWPAAGGGLLVVIALAVIVFRDQAIYFRGLAVVSLAAGACLGAWVQVVSQRRRNKEQSPAEGTGELATGETG